MLCVLIITVHLLSWVEGGCRSHCTEKKNDNTIYFGLMLSFPDPLGRKALAAAFEDGHDIAPAAYLAVEQINNRSDMCKNMETVLHLHFSEKRSSFQFKESG